MLASTMFFASEVQKCPEIKKAKVDKKELDLAVNLINQMTEPFKPEIYKDEYNEKLKKAIKKKLAGSEIVESKEDNSAPDNVINLMEALQKSLSFTKKPKTKVASK